MRRTRSIAVLLAAGEGRRMGKPKALLEYSRGETFLGHLAAMCRQVGFEPLAVVGCEAEAVLGAHPGLSCVENAGWREGGQLSSARVGLREALSRGAERVLLCPVDIPGWTPETAEAVARVLEDAEAASGAVLAAVPVFGGERGHPLGLTRAAAERVLADGAAEHLRAALRQLEVREVPVADEGAVRDFDTPEEYQRFFGRPPSTRG
jgi:CTP:molybdopterin cytidylyltransferase MocA